MGKVLTDKPREEELARFSDMNINFTQFPAQ
jgi:hypothetical protein